MYPQSDLARLAACKVALRGKIRVRRAQFMASAAEVARPFRWFDRARALLRHVAPLAQAAAVPLLLAAAPALLPRFKFLGPLLRWAPIVMGAARMVQSRNPARRG